MKATDAPQPAAAVVPAIVAFTVSAPRTIGGGLPGIARGLIALVVHIGDALLALPYRPSPPTIVVGEIVGNGETSDKE